MKLIGFLVRLVFVLAALAVAVPLALLGGLWVWLRLTEDADEEPLALEQEAA